MQSDAAGRGTAEALVDADADAEAAAKPSAMVLLCDWPSSLAKACMMSYCLVALILIPWALVQFNGLSQYYYICVGYANVRVGVLLSQDVHVMLAHRLEYSGSSNRF